MKYKDPHLNAEFNKKLAPEVRAVVLDLEAWGRPRGIPEPVITCVGRTAESNKAVGGVANSLHLDWRAADLRDTHYTAEQFADVVAHLKERCPLLHYELVIGIHGTGSHIHIGVKRRPTPNA